MEREDLDKCSKMDGFFLKLILTSLETVNVAT